MSYPLPLPSLTPDDPENRLSHESRQRIARALIEAERIQAQALSVLEARYRAERSSGDIGFAKYLSSGSAFVDLIHSRMEAAGTVLRVEAEEYRKLGLPDSHFREIMRGKIEGTVYSLELTSVQARALELEFVFATSQQTEDEPRSKNVSAADTGNIPDAAARHLHPERAADRVKAFMHKKGLTKRAFAKMIGTSERTVGYVLAGVRVGKETRVLVAKTLGTTPEELFRE
jgi:lambda repressor-like predicted transcriptional regulator